MPGLTRSVTAYVPPRRVRRAGALTLVFAGVVAAGAATGAWGVVSRPHQGPTTLARDGDRTVARPAGSLPAARGGVDRDPLDDAAARAREDGKSGTDAAAEVLGRSGDTWSAVYSAREYEGFALALDGAYVGVGLTVRRAGGGVIEVDGVRPGGPAERAGIVPGDRLRTVDGAEVTGRPVTEVVSLLRGLTPAGAGSGVRLGLERDDRRWERTLHRERLVTPSVQVERVDGEDEAAPATVIKVAAFTRGTGERVRDAVRAAAPGEGVLLDLRGNSGGLITEATTAASAFLDGGPVATYDIRGRQHALRAEPGGDTRRPLVVLVDGGTMSAAELLAGALQDRGRAIVVGAPTFGKGSVQMPTRLADGSVAELTVGHYRTPSGRAVDDSGIVPDLVVRGDAEHRARTVLSGLGGGS
ncbi:S41 family peptidase [Streptomyces sp. NPDC049555]|uniref:S41 family peptidase n=1 Tax=unclassified Streptomyces TaxID=2593676 RepID=UPI00342DAC7B